MIKAIRVFYRLSDGEVVWAFTLEAPEEKLDPKFPTTIEQDLAELPDKPKLDAIGSVILDTDGNFIKLGGVSEDYACITETDPTRIAGFLASDSNRVVDGQLVIGEPRPPAPEPPPPLSTHPARIDAVNPGAVKPATVTRIFLTEGGFTTLWNGKEYQYDCYVTQNIVDEWQAGKIAVGDFVLIHYLEGDITKPILTHKIYHSWGG